MNGAFYIGATGLSTQQRALDVVAHNITNMNTAGFKRSRVRFAEMAAPIQTAQEDLPLVPLQRGDQLGGVQLAATPRVWSQGDLKQTGGQLDIAIDGSGFIELLGPAGQTLLWRGGAMKVTEDGYLAAADGTLLKGMISVPADATGMTIARDGTITAAVPGGEGPREIGHLDIVMVKDLDGLTEAGGGYYASADPSAVYTVTAGEEGGGVFAQGSMEQANVVLTDEMVSLMLLQRAYAASAQLVQAGDQLMSIANNLRR